MFQEDAGRSGEERFIPPLRFEDEFGAIGRYVWRKCAMLIQSEFCVKRI